MSEQVMPYKIGRFFLQLGTKEIFQLIGYELRETPNGKEVFYLLDPKVPDFSGGFPVMPVNEYSLEKYFALLCDNA